jgi:hypothetical protein
MAATARRSGTLRAIHLLLVMLIGIVLAACGGSSASPVLSTVGNPVGSAAMPEAAAAASEGPFEERAASGVDDGTGVLPEPSGGPPLSAPRDDLEIVYTGSLQLVVDNLATALARGKAAVLATGGYVGASQESNDGDRSVATITYRVPATRWEDALDQLRGLATKVVAEQTQATEVGGQIVDLEARITNLRASESTLQEIAKGTGKIPDLLQVESQLTEVRGQIEQLEGQRAQLKDQVAYGTLVTTFGLEAIQVQAQAQGWDPKQDVDGALATLIAAGQSIVSGLIWFTIVWLPVILVLVLVVLAARWLVRRVAPSAGGGGPVPGWGEGPGGS